MTREEREAAVERLNALKQFIGYDKDSEIVKATQKSLDMAIEVLKQESILDKPYIKGDYYDGFKNGLRTAEWRYSKLKAEIRDWQTDIHDNEYDAEKYDFVFEPIYASIDKYMTENEVEDT